MAVGTVIERGEDPALVRPQGWGFERVTDGKRRTRRAVLLAPLIAAALLLCFAALDGFGSANKEPVSESISKSEMDHMFRDKVFLADYPKWSKSVAQLNTPPAANHGVWKYYKGPPFLQRVTMYAGNDVDISFSGNLVRRVLGLPLSYGKWEGNSYIFNFDSQQMRFLMSNEHSALIVPPLTMGNLPLLPDSAKSWLHSYAAVGHNTLIVCGGPASVEFLNMNVLDNNGGAQLEPAWSRGPYEKQESTIGTPFQSLPVTLPNDLNHAHGVRKHSLPQEAVSYFETDGVSVVFSIPYQQGKVMFLGFDFFDLSKPWVKTLIAAAQFAE